VVTDKVKAEPLMLRIPLAVSFCVGGCKFFYRSLWRAGQLALQWLQL
jgi:hypothetical protein